MINLARNLKLKFVIFAANFGQKYATGVPRAICNWKVGKIIHFHISATFENKISLTIFENNC